MVKFNRAELWDKIYACWLGKNIGGTIGTPYEGRRELLDVQGFSTPEGTVLANDDLDLQIVWLKAIQERGLNNITAQVLGEYWLNYITPHWNEYGIGKSHMKSGLLPPISGEYKNVWKDSNGAWIRSEIWACVAPGNPDDAIQYAFEDACVDHGMGEGTFAEIFTAAIESAAFVIKDVRQLIEIALSKLPEDCRVARSVRLAVDAYDSGLGWKAARQKILDDSADLGWFQAPANVAYVIIGLLYGEGDFKKSILIAVNCGDDTDCTGATLGALLGIINGTSIIPEDWRRHIGDDITTIALDRGSYWNIPRTCTELTDRVLKIASTQVFVHDGATDLQDVSLEHLKWGRIAKKLANRSPYSFSIDFIYASAIVEYEGAPEISPNGELRLKVKFYNKMPDPKHLNLRWILPEGWSVSASARNVFLEHDTDRRTNESADVYVTVTANEALAPINRIILEAVCEGRPTVGLIPIAILG